MKCEKCGYDGNPDSARYCNQCGAELDTLDSESPIESTTAKNERLDPGSDTQRGPNTAQFGTIAKVVGAIVVITIVLVQTHLVNNPFSSASDESNNDNSQLTPTASVTFCKKVDDNLNPIDPGDSFKRGQVYIRLESNVTFGVSNLLLYVCSMKGNGFSFIDNYNLQADPQGNIFAVPYTFTESGSYRIAFRKYMNENFAVGIVTIR